MGKWRKKDTDNSEKWRFLYPKIKKIQKGDTLFRHPPEIPVSEKCKIAKKGHKFASNAEILCPKIKKIQKRDTFFRYPPEIPVSEKWKFSEKGHKEPSLCPTPNTHLQPLPSPGYDKITPDGVWLAHTNHQKATVTPTTNDVVPDGGQNAIHRLSINETARYGNSKVRK